MFQKNVLLKSHSKMLKNSNKKQGFTTCHDRF